MADEKKVSRRPMVRMAKVYCNGGDSLVPVGKAWITQEPDGTYARLGQYGGSARAAVEPIETGHRRGAYIVRNTPETAYWALLQRLVAGDAAAEPELRERLARDGDGVRVLKALNAVCAAPAHPLKRAVKDGVWERVLDAFYATHAGYNVSDSDMGLRRGW